MPIQHAFVSNRAVLLTLGYGVKSLFRLIAYDVIEVVHRQSSGFNAVEVEDGLSPRVEGEATHLATFFSRSSAIGIIFGTTFHELFDRVSPTFVFELYQESSSQQVGLSSCHEADDRVGVHVEYTGEEGVQTFAIQLDGSVRRGEGSHKDVGVGTQMSSFKEWYTSIICSPAGRVGWMSRSPSKKRIKKVSGSLQVVTWVLLVR